MGPWARSLVSVIAGRAEQPSDEVRDLTVEVGAVSARVGECTVSLSTERVPPRIWAAMTRFAQNRGQLKEAVEGRSQSVHLEHLMSEDWGEPLIPRASAIARACTCDEGGACEHITALAFAFAERDRRRSDGAAALARLLRGRARGRGRTCSTAGAGGGRRSVAGRLRFPSRAQCVRCPSVRC